MRWLGYARVSRVGDRVDTLVSPELQAERIESYAAQRGLDVEMLAPELDVSGGEVSRPILDEAIERVERGEAAGIIVAQLDRLSRAGIADTHRIIEAIGPEAVISVAEQFDGSTPQGRAARNFSLVIGEMQREQAAAQIAAAKRRAVRAGIWPMSLVPIGYVCERRKHGGDGRLYPGPERGRVERAYRERVTGARWVELARILGSGSSGAQRIIANRVYLGEIRLRVEGEEIVNRDAHEPLVDRATWEAAQGGTRVHRIGAPALLAGLIRCAACSRSMSLNRWARSTGYRCMTRHSAAGPCPAPAIISQRAVEDYVEALVVPWLDWLEATGHPPGDALADALERLKAAEQARDDFAAATAGMGREHIAAGMSAHARAVDEARAEVARQQRARPSAVPVGRMSEWYRSQDVAARRHVLRRSLSVVWVNKGRGRVSERVRVIDAEHGPAELSHAGRGGNVPLTRVADGDLPGQIRALSAQQLADTLRGSAE